MRIRNINKILHFMASFSAALVLVAFFAGSILDAATGYTEPVGMNDYDFTANTGTISDWSPWNAAGMKEQILANAAKYAGRPYSEMDCANYAAQVLCDSGCVNFGNYMINDGNMQVSEFLKLFAGQIDTGDPNVQRVAVNGSSVVNAARMSNEQITLWCQDNCDPGDFLVFYDEEGKDLHIGIYSGVKDRSSCAGGDSVHGAYMWHSGVSTGVAERLIAYISGSGKKGHTITFMQRFRTSNNAAFTGFAIDKKTADGMALAGASYGVFSSEADCLARTNQLGSVTDDNLDGMTCDYHGSNGENLMRLDNTGQGFSKSIYITETFCPYLIRNGSSVIDLRCCGWGENGQCEVSDIREQYRFFDSNIYRVDMFLGSIIGNSGRMVYTVSLVKDGSTTKLYDKTIDSFPLQGGCVYITNQSDSAASMIEASSLKLAKETVTNLDTSSTVFTILENDLTVATYRYSQDGFKWFDCDGNYMDISSLPVKSGAGYVVRESFDIPVMSCADGNTLEYCVVNDSIGWTPDGENSYTYGFTAGSLPEYGIIGVTAENNWNASQLSLTKTVSDEGDTADGFVFELWNEEGTIRVADGLSDNQGRVLWTTGDESDVYELTCPSGSYEIREYVPSTRSFEDTQAEYYYHVPSGFTASEDGRYWYKKITIAASQRINQNVANDRSQADIAVCKLSEDGKIADIAFDIYAGGNGALPLWESEPLCTGTTEDDGVAVYENVPLGWYRIKERVPEGYSCTWIDGQTEGYKVIHMGEMSDNQVVSVTAVNRISAKVVIEKCDEWTGAVISDYEGLPAVFSMYADTDCDCVLDDNERISYRQITDSDKDGILEISDVSSGHYLIEEKAAPYGYCINSNLCSVVIDSHEGASVRIFDSPYQSSLRLVKNDSETGEFINGAGFTVYEDTNGDGIHQDCEPEAVTADSQRVTFEVKRLNWNEGEFADSDTGEIREVYSSDNLRAGKYVIVETTLPQGYFYCDENGNVTSDMNSAAVSINVPEDGADIDNAIIQGVLIKNKPGSAVVFKCDDNGINLEGASFEVYSDEGCSSLAGELEYESDTGKYVLRGLGEGTYYLKEMKAPDGYLRDDTIYEFNITGECCTAVITNSFAGQEGLAGRFVNYRPIAGTVLLDDHINTVDKSTVELEGDYCHEVSYGTEVCITDYVFCKGLEAGQTYTVTGELMLKSTGEPWIDANGSPYVSVAEFEASSCKETVEVDFTVDTTMLNGDSVVAFETIRTEDGLFEHKDINSMYQTLGSVYVSTAADSNHGGKIIYPDEVAAVTDRVSYRGLCSDTTYRIEASLYMSNGEPLMRDGSQVVNTVVFTPDSCNGTVNVPVSFSTSGMSDGQTVVIYENIYDVATEEEKDRGIQNADIEIGRHNDISSKDQSVTLYSLPATGEEIADYTMAGIAMLMTGSAAVFVIYVTGERKKYI